MATLSQKRFWVRARRIFRAFRIGILFAIFLIVSAGVYLNTIGLPDFLKEPLLNKLRQNGLEVDYRRVYLRGLRGIIFENARFTRRFQLVPEFSAAEGELTLDLPALMQSELKWNALRIQEGELRWPLSKLQREFLTLDHVHAELDFLPHDQVEIKRFAARFQNAPVQISGVITHVSALRHLKLSKSKQQKKPDASSKLNQFADLWKKIKFAAPPELNLKIQGDARDFKMTQGELKLAATGAETPWGKFLNLNLTADLNPPTSPLQLHLAADRAQTIWGRGENIDLSVKLVSRLVLTNPIEAKINFVAQQFETAWMNRTNRVQAAQINWNGNSTHFLTNFIPLAAQGNLSALQLEAHLGTSNFFSAQNAQGRIVLGRRAANALPQPEKSWGNWSKLEPFTLDWNGDFLKIKSPKLEAQKLFCAGRWSAPDLVLEKIQGELYDGHFEVAGQLNISSRAAQIKATSDFDLQKIVPLLTDGGKRFFQKYAWENPPQVRGQAQAILPAWTNSKPDWRAVLESLQLDGNVSAGKGSYRQVPFDSGETSFNYTNRIWNLPDIHVVRPEGEARLNLISNERTRDFHWRVQSEINPKIAREQLPKTAQVGLDYFEFTLPPFIEAEITGNWEKKEQISVQGKIAATNFTYRGTSVDAARAAMEYTDLFLKLNHGRLERGGKVINAPKIEIDFSQNKIFFTDIDSTMDPMLVTRAIGKKVAAAIEPYQFAEPPSVQLNGNLTIGRKEDADMHFVVKGDQFKWGIFQADKISGNVDWTGETLSLTNIQA
ncbi:MAG: hypothetical protein M3Y82_07750, partial [Verrucomicrobiota bacterium]|nr:hypothetical protein [Verrucomicrobiota bacterium]